MAEAANFDRRGAALARGTPPTSRLTRAVLIAGPSLHHGLRMWASVSFSLYVAYWLELQTPYFAGVTAVIVCLLPGIGASLRRSWFRLVGAFIGSVAIVVLTACAPQDRPLFLTGLALWGAACAFVGTILKNFTGYAALLSGISAAFIASGQLGATGGGNGTVFLVAVNFVTLVAVGIASAGIVFGLTDSLGAPRRLAKRFGDIVAGIAANFALTLASAGQEGHDIEPLQRDLFGRVAALDPSIEESLGESSIVHHYAPVLQAAIDGCFAALAGWRTVADRLLRMPHEDAQQHAAIVLETIPHELTGGDSDRWATDPTALYQSCEVAIDALVALPATSPSLRSLADGAAEVLAGLSHALNGVALLVAEPARPAARRRGAVGLRVPDWLPAFVNAGRAFAAIVAVMLFWIVSAWPNGALAIAFTVVIVLLIAPLADMSYATAKDFATGFFLAAIFAAIIGFAVLPAFSTQSFAVLCIAMGIVLIPAGALLRQRRRAAMFTASAILFVVILAPSNPMNYDPARFYNEAIAVVAGSTVAALFFILLPSLSPAFRVRRLLTLSLRDLRRLAKGRRLTDWEGRIYGRLAAMPNQATPLQRAEILAALSVGTAVIQLRQIMDALGSSAGLTSALAAIGQGDSAAAVMHLRNLDVALAALTQTQTILRARGKLVGVAEALTNHAAYFDASP